MGGVSKVMSPEAIIKGREMNVALHCRIPFGGYAQVYARQVNTNNVMVSRTVGGISLGPTGNMQGTYKFISLETNRIIKGRKFTVLPMPDDVITTVNKLGKDNIDNIVLRDRIGET